MKLKPCPFCGKDNVKVGVLVNPGALYYVSCQNKKCSSSSTMCTDDLSAIEAWNHRPFEAHAVAFEAHAVEVLAKQLFITAWKNISEWEHCEAYGGQEMYRAEARALLGIENEKGASE